MAKLDASKSGTFKIGGEIEINRLGFGAMRITGKGIWGEPEDRAEVLRTLKRVPELGIDFIDTANSYGPDVSEELIHEALFPYKGSDRDQGRLSAHGSGGWEMDGRPEWLRERALSSCKRLGVKRIDLWQLHRIDPKVPRKAQFAAIKSLIDDGIIRYRRPVRGVGRRHRGCVQGLPGGERAEPLQSRRSRQRGRARLLRGERHRLHSVVSARGRRARQGGSILDRIAKAHGAAPSQIALAWVLKRSPVMLPIPGTSKVKHLEENVAAVNIELTEDEFALLDREGRAASAKQR